MRRKFRLKPTLGLFMAAVMLAGCTATNNKLQYKVKEAGWETGGADHPAGGVLCVSGRNEAGGRYFVFSFGEGKGEHKGVAALAFGFHDPKWDMSAGTEYPVHLALRRGRETLYEWNETGLVVAEAGQNKEMLMTFTPSQNDIEKIVQHMTEDSDSLHLTAPDTGEAAFVVDLTNAKTAWWNLLKCMDISNDGSSASSAKHPFRPVKQ